MSRLHLPHLSLRSLALAMLLAGAALGVLAARTLWAEKPRPTAGVLNEHIENKVRAYQEVYGLDESATVRVRRCLQEYDRAVTQLYQELRREQAPRFQALSQEANKTIDDILREGGHVR